MNTNIIQKLVMAIGSISLIIAIISTPKVRYGEGGVVLKAGNASSYLANMLDWKTVLIYCGAIIFITITLFLITSTNKRAD
jgi:hypothetical protein